MTAMSSTAFADDVSRIMQELVVSKLTFEISRSSTAATVVRWSTVPRAHRYNVNLTEITSQAAAERKIYNGDVTNTAIRIKLKAGNYKVTVKGMRTNSNGDSLCVAKGSTRFQEKELLVSKLTLEISRSSTAETVMRWSAEPRAYRYNVNLTEITSQDGAERKIYNGDVTNTGIRIKLKAGNYKVIVQGMRTNSNGESVCVAIGSARFQEKVYQSELLVSKLTLEISRSSTADTVMRWSARPIAHRYNVNLTEITSQDGAERKIYNGDVTNTAIKIKLKAGNYKVTVKGMRTNSNGDSICVAKGSTRFREEEFVVSKLTLEISRSSTTEADVTWSGAPGADRYNVQLTESSSQDGAETEIYNGDVTNTAIGFNLNEAGNFYKVIVKGMRQTSNGDPLCVAKGSASFRADLTKAELKELHRRAVAFVTSHRKRTLEWFYRTKMPAYFQDIELHRDNKMEVYTKDSNGDQGSPINGVLKGLFFSVNVDMFNGQPRSGSPFGSKRLLIPAQVMFQNLPNLYFTDFYCNFKAHYVTLVMTKDGSEADKFCREKLIPLDVATNPFVQYEPTMFGISCMCVTCGGLMVEILCTEDIDIGDMISRCGAKFGGADWNGKPTHGGLPKNPNCVICNLR